MAGGDLAQAGLELRAAFPDQLEKAESLDLREHGESGGRADAVGPVTRRDEAAGRLLHHAVAADHDAEGKAVAHRLGVDHEVGFDAESGHGPGEPVAEAAGDFVDDENRASGGGASLHLLEEVVLRRL